MSTELGYRLVDADNHYYEPDDCFSRHLEGKYADRAVHVIGEGQARRWLFGDRPLSFHEVPRDQVMRPGDLELFFKGADSDRKLFKIINSDLDVFRHRGARLKLMDSQGVEAAIMLPSMALTVEAEIHDDSDATYANFRSFNRWLEEEWGFNDRIFAVPIVSLVDREQAVAELERLLNCGARLVMIKEGPVYGRSPADTYFDPFWARINEARIPLVLHIDASGYIQMFSVHWGEPASPREPDVTPFQWFTCMGSRPTLDTIASMILWNLFGRFPNLRVLSIENGADWVPTLFKLDGSVRYTRTTAGEARDKVWPGGKLERLPSEIIRDQIYVSPFHEEKVVELARRIGVAHVLFGSDYPHPEGMAKPSDYVDTLRGLSDAEVKRIMRDNTAELLRMN